MLRAALNCSARSVTRPSLSGAVAPVAQSARDGASVTRQRAAAGARTYGLTGLLGGVFAALTDALDNGAISLSALLALR